MILRIVGALLKVSYDCWDLIFGDIPPIIVILQIKIQQWQSDDCHNEKEHAEEAKEEEYHHPNQRRLRIRILLAIIFVRKIQIYSIKGP